MIPPLPLATALSSRPRAESLFDTEAYSSPKIFFEGAEVELVMGLGNNYNWALVRRKHDRKRLVVRSSDLRRVPGFTLAWPQIVNYFNLPFLRVA